jgi:F1F0 ATPase subunit 2
MQIDPLVMGFGVAGGVLLGFLFFGGLWWSLKGISRRYHPKRFLGLSFLVRTLMALAGFWLALHHSVSAFLGAIVGFAVMRFILARWLGAEKKGGYRGAN